MSDGSMNGDTETIFAVASGSVPAGVAVLRLSGPGAGKALADMAGGLPAARRASVRRLRDPGGELLDEALVLWFPGPASFTGEDVVELHLHGGRATVAAVTAALGGRDDFRPAEAGEFTRRAFYNGRLDLTQVEGLADLVAAETEAQRRLAQRQSGGEAARRFDGWRNRVIALSAQVEASLDFADEDLPETLLDDMRDKILGLVEEITQNMDHEGRGERLRTGLQIAILGAPNVGKSSLLNRMARRDVAIVSAQAGTTRDVVEVHLDLGGWPVTIADTAGLRLTGDEVEKEGIRRAHARAGLSDLRLCIFDASAGDPFDDATGELAGSESVAVLNKCDMVSARRLADLERRAVSELGAAAAVGLSARTGTGMARLESVLEEFARQSMDQGQGCLLTRARHRVALRECTDALGRAVAGMDTAVGTELVAEDLRLAARALGRITGRIDVEDVLDRVFSEFCIGK